MFHPEASNVCPDYQVHDSLSCIVISFIGFGKFASIGIMRVKGR